VTGRQHAFSSADELLASIASDRAPPGEPAADTAVG
jgi:hypothetical protein